MSAAEIVDKVRNYSHVLREVGVGYADIGRNLRDHPKESSVPLPRVIRILS